MLRYGFILLLLLLSRQIYCQWEASNWFFGQNAALLFDSCTIYPSVNPNLNSIAGCTSISDSTGTLLLYSDGENIWDAEHQLVPNGSGLSGHQGINPNSVFIPFPENPKKYFLFTVNKDTATGLRYTLLDLSGDKPAIIEKNVFITSTGLDRFAAIHHCNGRDFWVVLHSLDLKSFKSYLINKDGIQPQPIISACLHHEINNTGPLKFSPESSRLIVPVSRNHVLAAVYLFDNDTGEITPGGEIHRESYTYLCGVAFSASGKFLYISTGGHYYKLLQYDLSYTESSALNNSKIEIGNGNVYGLQLAADGRIYVSKMNMPFLDCIQQPEKPGKACMFTRKAVELNPALAQMHLPAFVQSFLYKPQIIYSGTCKGDTTYFNPALLTHYDSLSWMISKNKEDYATFSDQPKARLVLPDTGTYAVKLKVFRCSKADSVVQQISIIDKPDLPPFMDTVYTGKPIEIVLHDQYDSIFWNTFLSGNILEIDREGTHTVEVHKNGCFVADTFYVRRIAPHLYFPNAFTPNNDGLNDIFISSATEDIALYKIMIFSRNGQMVFMGTTAAEGWDGRFHGKNCPRGIYLWKAEYSLNDSSQEKFTKHGSVMLIR